MKNSLLIGLLAILCFSCDTTDPNKNEEPLEEILPGRRDYSWSIDSISRPGFPYLKSIWGSSPTDIWGAGFSEDVRDCLWHYDGVSWKRSAEGTPITISGIGSPIVGAVWGTAYNDVWAFGGRRFSNPERTEPFVMHYNGVEWSEVIGDINNMPDGLFDIYGVGKDEFWIATLGYVSHYYQGNWKKYLISENRVVLSINGKNNKVYLTSYPLGVDTLFLMMLEEGEFRVKDSGSLFNGKFGPSGILTTNSNLYTFSNNGIYSSTLSNGQIVVDSWKHDINTANGGFSNSFLISNSDIWTVGLNQFPYHFNGTDWKAINIGNSSPYNSLSGIWGDGQELFICDSDNGIVYHGK